MASAFLELAKKVLLETHQFMSPSEIWEYAKSKGYDRDLGTTGKSPGATMGAKLYIDLRDNIHTEFSSMGARPKKFGLRTSAGFSTPSIATGLPTGSASLSVTTPSYSEKKLHPFLAYFAFFYLNAFLKTIDHLKSRAIGRSFGEWVHPDMVGCYYPFSDWKKDVVNISNMLGNTSIKLYSFELKRELSFSNLRESFFQAVSNSSWANEGYLAAAQIDDNPDFRSELSRLSSSFGIGVIKLDIKDPDSSEIIEPARKREIDWDSVNKLANMENSDFDEFLTRIQNDFKTCEVRPEKYDVVMDKDALIATIKP